jgi:hypothetical protein
MIPKKPVPDLIRGENIQDRNRFLDKIAGKQKPRAQAGFSPCGAFVNDREALTRTPG